MHSYLHRIKKAYTHAEACRNTNWVAVSCRFCLGCIDILRSSEEWMPATGCKCCVSLKELKAI